MARERHERSIPYLTVVFAIAAIVCQSLVLAGTCKQTDGLLRLGYSVRGWASVGTNVSHGLDSFSVKIAEASNGIVETLDQLTHIQAGLDFALSKVGRQLDTLLLPVRSSVTGFSDVIDLHGLFQTIVRITSASGDGLATDSTPATGERRAHGGLARGAAGAAWKQEHPDDEELWPAVGLVHTRCAEAKELVVASQLACQAEAVAAGHKYYQYDGAGACATTESCTTLITQTRAPWEIHYPRQEGGGFTFYAFSPLRLRGDGPDVHLAEISFQAAGEFVHMTGAVAHNHRGVSPPGEGASKAIDGMVTTRWTDAHRSALIVEFPKGTVVQAFSFVTPSDHGERDPVAWQVQGSTNGVGWVTLHLQCSEYPTPTDRNMRTEWFQLVPQGQASCSASTGAAAPITTSTATSTQHQIEETVTVDFDGVNTTIHQVIDDIGVLLRMLVVRLRPLFRQLEKWMKAVSEKTQPQLETFGVTMERVQSLFDTLTKNIKQNVMGGNDLAAVTFSLFDVSNTGDITLEDLQSVSTIYGITALGGSAAKALFSKCDVDRNGKLSEQEFSLLVKDPSVPGIAQVVARAYADRLSEVSSPLKFAWTRAAAASAVAKYVQVVGAKNATKVGWVAQALVNGTLTTNFTAELIIELAMQDDNPDRLATVGVGEALVRRVVAFDPSAMVQVVALMQDPEWWLSEGFDPATQPWIISRVAKWAVGGIHDHHHTERTPLMAEMLGGSRVGRSLEKELSEVRGAPSRAFHEKVVPQTLLERVQRRGREASAVRRGERARRTQRLLSSAGTKRLFQEVLGGDLPASIVQDWEAARAVNMAAKAAPETLEWTAWLANNASAVAAELQLDVLAYSPTVGQALDSWAGRLNSMVKRVWQFLQMVLKYTSTHGIQTMEEIVEEFVRKAPDELVRIAHDLANKPWRNTTVMEFGVWPKLRAFLADLQGLLPNVVSAMEAARGGVLSVSGSLSSNMEVLHAQGPIFDTSASIAKASFAWYYVMWLSITLAIAAFNFRVSGFLGGTALEADKEYEPPQTLKERLRLCFSGAGECFKKCTLDNPLFFWSVLLLVDILVLVSFYICLTLCVAVAIGTYAQSGCSQLYILGDETICSEAMGVMRKMLSFLSGYPNYIAEDACVQHYLMTCQVFTRELAGQGVLTYFAGLFASMFSFNLLVESANLYERARWQQYRKDVLKDD